MPYCVIHHGRPCGSFATPEAAVVEAMRVIGAPIRIIGDQVIWQGDAPCTVDQLLWRLARHPLMGVKIVPGTS